MSTGGSSSGDIFDLRKLKRLIELMNEHELGEIDLRDGDVRVRLRKEGMAPVVPTVIPAVSAPAAAPAPAAGAPAPAAKPAADDKHVLIKSPMVGTFFSAASPDTPPFVKVGDHVGPETTVCIIEAMKVFNEIPAECSGQIVAVLVSNGAAVEFGQPLFKVAP